jgi:hypothetical protein
MAMHNSIPSMLEESLKEYIFVAECCVNFKKDDSWGENQTGGCLGYPAALIMLSIIDAIGSYANIKVNIDGKEKNIKAGNITSHFYILNSKYYGQDLSEVQINKIKGFFRDTLSHNAVLAPETILIIDKSEKRAFFDKCGNFFINVSALLELNKLAVNNFINESHSIVTGSNQERCIKNKTSNN